MTRSLRKNSTIKNICFSILAVLLFFLIAECICRFIEYRKLKSYLPPIYTKSNSCQKKEDSLTIQFYGGSTVAGVHHGSVSFVKQFGYFLNKLYPEIKVDLINFGQPGMNVHEVRETVEKK